MKTKQTEEQISRLPLPAFAFFSAWLGGVLFTTTGIYSVI